MRRLFISILTAILIGTGADAGFSALGIGAKRFQLHVIDKTRRNVLHTAKHTK